LRNSRQVAKRFRAFGERKLVETGVGLPGKPCGKRREDKELIDSKPSRRENIHQWVSAPHGESVRYLLKSAGCTG
jgi:hypothetical protein